MNIITRLQQKKPLLSFEVFPPKTPIGEENLFHELHVMVSFKPDFISVTYGAGGSTREKTLEIAT
ncbi:MAG TPA: methylenetetrahydrofolate reductase, partial [Spirochaetota bacterium]|nr:methylenetetrahydrofolate reductase [Spirochaetota bacterium]